MWMPGPDDGRRQLLRQGIRRIVRMRELGPKTPRWGRAWKNLLWRYQEVLHREVTMIRAQEFCLGRSFLGRLPTGGDVVESLTTFCREHGVGAGWISAIGTVRWAVLGYFDQEQQSYLRISVEDEMEIVSCQGNVSLKDGQSFVHLHAVLSGREGETLAGHLFESEIFVGEFYLQELEGPALERKLDSQSGLSLWDILQRAIDEGRQF
jgi:predicted DNA-binding protein with PD1-like motif